MSSRVFSPARTHAATVAFAGQVARCDMLIAVPTVLGHVGIRRSHASIIGLWIITRLSVCLSVCLPARGKVSGSCHARLRLSHRASSGTYRLVLSRRSACSDSRVNKHPHKLYFTVSCFRSIIILFRARLSSRSLVAYSPLLDWSTTAAAFDHSKPDSSVVTAAGGTIR